MFSRKLKSAWQYLIPQLGVTRLFGYLANKPNSSLVTKVINWYIKHYNVDMSEALEQDVSCYDSFNDFFIRKLKPDARPLSDSPLISPADGCISQIGQINHGKIFQAKGFNYSVNSLLGNHHSAESFINGQFATIYLSPKDYHRVHMPCDAHLAEMRYVPGKLFSVNHQTASTVPNLFARNERLVVFFDTEFGRMAMIMVGAINVASIGTSWQGDIAREKEIRQWVYPNPRCSELDFHKGQEMGYFKLGSTVIILFANPKIAWDEQLTSGSSIRYGQKFGNLTPE